MRCGQCGGGQVSGCDGQLVGEWGSGADLVLFYGSGRIRSGRCADRVRPLPAARRPYPSPSSRLRSSRADPHGPGAPPLPPRQGRCACDPHGLNDLVLKLGRAGGVDRVGGCAGRAERCRARAPEGRGELHGRHRPRRRRHRRHQLGKRGPGAGLPALRLRAAGRTCTRPPAPRTPRSRSPRRPPWTTAAAPSNWRWNADDGLGRIAFEDADLVVDELQLGELGVECSRRPAG